MFRSERPLTPALADLLASPQGDDLRARLAPDGIHVVMETIAPQALLGPGELRFYRGAEPSTTEPTRSTVATGWGVQAEPPPDTSDGYLPALLLAGTVVVIVLLLIFVSLMSRLGGPARDRRSAVIRMLHPRNRFAGSPWSRPVLQPSAGYAAGAARSPGTARTGSSSEGVSGSGRHAQQPAARRSGRVG